jgi:hypothetical protein
MNLSDQLRRLSYQVTSILLTWDDDSRVWECSIIASGVRFTGRSEGNYPQLAVINAQQKMDEWVGAVEGLDRR